MKQTGTSVEQTFEPICGSKFDIGGYPVTSLPLSEVVSGWELVQTKTGWNQLMQTYILFWVHVQRGGGEYSDMMASESNWNLKVRLRVEKV